MISNFILVIITTVYALILVKLFVKYLNRPKEVDPSYTKLHQGGGPVELIILLSLIGIIAWSLRESSKKNKIKKADAYISSQNFSKALDIFIGIKDWERAAEIVVKAPVGTQILLLRRLQANLSQSSLKNLFLKIGDKYRNTQYSELSAIAYQLAEMPWRAAQSYIGTSRVDKAIEIINTSPVFANDRNRAIRNLAKYAYDTNHPLESARLLQSIGAEDEATAVLVATGRDVSSLKPVSKVQDKESVKSKTKTYI